MIPRRTRRRSVAFGLIAVALLAGCPHDPARVPTEPANVPGAPGSVSSAASVAHTADAEPPHKPAPPKSGPLPPERVIEPMRIDRRCRVDADCVAKDPGSCCAAPTCVNRDSPVDAAATKAACEPNGTAAHCDRPVVEPCACRQGQCVTPGSTPAGGSVDGAPSPPDSTR